MDGCVGPPSSMFALDYFMGKNDRAWECEILDFHG